MQQITRFLSRTFYMKSLIKKHTVSVDLHMYLLCYLHALQRDVGNAALRVTKTTSSAVSVLVVVAITEPGTAGDRSGAASGAAASPPLPRSTPACCSAVRAAAQLTLFGSSTSKWPSRRTWR